MTRSAALPLMASGIALLTLAATVIPFEAEAMGLAGSAPWERLIALRPPAVTAVLLSVIAGLACWRAPRHAGALLLLALALGTVGGTATLVAMPDLVPAPAQVAISTH